MVMTSGDSSTFNLFVKVRAERQVLSIRQLERDLGAHQQPSSITMGDELE